VLALLGVTLSAPSLSEEQAVWNLYKASFGKTYQDETVEALRMKIFLENKKQIEEHNESFKAGQTTFELGLNQFSDMLVSEHREQNNGFSYNHAEAPAHEGAEWVAPSDDISVPESIDWRTYGAVTGVKNQGQCGSCWAFSSTGSLEGQHFRKTNTLVSLSEQNLVDCANAAYGNYGCKGGWQDNAYKYIKANGGIDTESSYPYYAVQYACNYNAANSAATVTGFVKLPTYDENALKQAVGTVGPVAVAIDASHSSFQSYRSGVYYDSACSQTALDHAVLVVGYGHDAHTNLDYWLVKNSWASSWGIGGYIKMIRNYSNHCGIASHALYPTV